MSDKHDEEEVGTEETTEERIDDVSEDESDDSSLQEELDRVRQALANANSESKQRRLKIRELESQLETEQKSGMTDAEKLEDQLSQLTAQNKSLMSQVKKHRISEATSFALQSLKLTPVNEAASQDLAGFVQNALNESDVELNNLTSETVKPVLRELLKTRGYLFSQKKAPDTDTTGGRKGEWQMSDEELAQLAHDMGLNLP